MTISESTTQAVLPEAEKEDLEFDQLRLRFFIGFIALLLPVVTPLVAWSPLASISASYYTNARDIFVGMSFMIGTLLWAYTGRPNTAPKTVEESGVRVWIRTVLRVDREREQGAVTTAGAIAAVITALFPTACNNCGADPISVIHYTAASILFAVTVYFCVFVLRDNAIARAKKKESQGFAPTKQMRRARFYVFCGVGIIICLLSAVVAQFYTEPVADGQWGFTYVAETVSLLVFGTAWLIASKILPWFADEDERPPLVQVLTKGAVPEGQASA
jgi:hypothetical protein